jgi:hypothetical protein
MGIQLGELKNLFLILRAYLSVCFRDLKVYLILKTSVFFFF